VLKALRY